MINGGEGRGWTFLLRPGKGGVTGRTRRTYITQETGTRRKAVVVVVEVTAAEGAVRLMDEIS